ncbi:hypothetical protein ACVBE9_03530 [Eionea flava]
MKKYCFVFALLLSNSVFAVNSCGSVKIEEVLSNKLYGSLVRVDNVECGRKGWVCLDPRGEYLDEKVSDRLYAQVLTAWSSGGEVTLTTAGANDVFVPSCGGEKRGFPVIEDFRSQ